MSVFTFDNKNRSSVGIIYKGKCVGVITPHGGESSVTLSVMDIKGGVVSSILGTFNTLEEAKEFVTKNTPLLIKAVNALQ